MEIIKHVDILLHLYHDHHHNHRLKLTVQEISPFLYLLQFPTSCKTENIEQSPLCERKTKIIFLHSHITTLYRQYKRWTLHLRCLSTERGLFLIPFVLRHPPNQTCPYREPWSRNVPG